jgi:septum formation protein
MKHPPCHVYLASRSLRRRELLRQIGVSFEVLLLREAPGRPIDLHEIPAPGEDPVAYVQRVARDKADAAWRRLTQRRLMRHPLLSADTTVAIDAQILGKPADRDEAAAFLRRLSGRWHDVHTAVAVAMDGRIEVMVSSTRVEFRPLAEPEIQAYVASNEPIDKAGGYAIQGRAALFVRAIAGSYSGVMGLPLFETGELLARFGCRVL